jgi:hypothetical protein
MPVRKVNLTLQHTYIDEPTLRKSIKFDWLRIISFHRVDSERDESEELY